MHDKDIATEKIILKKIVGHYLGHIFVYKMFFRIVMRTEIKNNSPNILSS